MSLHHADIASKLKRFLDRRQLPKRLEGKPQAEQDEIAALVTCIARYAPHHDLFGWWQKFEAAIGEAGSGSLWPTERDVREAASALKPVQSKAALQEADREQELAIIGKRLAEGDHVGEGWLWGRQAVDLIRRGLVDEPTMRKYRSSAYFSRKATYGADAAQKWEADAKQRHQDAIEMLKQEPERREVQIPDKSDRPAA